MSYSVTAPKRLLKNLLGMKRAAGWSGLVGVRFLLFIIPTLKQMHIDLI